MNSTAKCGCWRLYSTGPKCTVGDDPKRTPSRNGGTSRRSEPFLCVDLAVKRGTPGTRRPFERKRDSFGLEEFVRACSNRPAKYVARTALALPVLPSENKGVLRDSGWQARWLGWGCCAKRTAAYPLCAGSPGPQGCWPSRKGCTVSRPRRVPGSRSLCHEATPRDRNLPHIYLPRRSRRGCWCAPVLAWSTCQPLRYAARTTSCRSPSRHQNRQNVKIVEICHRADVGGVLDESRGDSGAPRFGQRSPILMQKSSNTRCDERTGCSAVLK